jgi:membrane protein DedA with SNARE-associated domain
MAESSDVVSSPNGMVDKVKKYWWVIVIVIAILLFLAWRQKNKKAEQKTP